MQKHDDGKPAKFWTSHNLLLLFLLDQNPAWVKYFQGGSIVSLGVLLVGAYRR